MISVCMLISGKDIDGVPFVNVSAVPRVDEIVDFFDGETRVLRTFRVERVGHYWQHVQGSCVSYVRLHVKEITSKVTTRL